MEVYVDDQLVKSTVLTEHLANFCKAFTIFGKYKMKLNPAKCTFGMDFIKFLSFIVSKRRIKVNPKKISGIMGMKSQCNINEVQRLTRQVGTINIFVSKAMNKCIPLFRVLQKANIWNEKCIRMFEKLKKYLTNPLLLNQTMSRETLFM